MNIEAATVRLVTMISATTLPSSMTRRSTLSRIKIGREDDRHRTAIRNRASAAMRTGVMDAALIWRFGHRIRMANMNKQRKGDHRDGWTTMAAATVSTITGPKCRNRP